MGNCCSQSQAETANTVGRLRKQNQGDQSIDQHVVPRKIIEPVDVVLIYLNKQSDNESRRLKDFLLDSFPNLTMVDEEHRIESIVHTRKERKVFLILSSQVDSRVVESLIDDKRVKQIYFPFGQTNDFHSKKIRSSMRDFNDLKRSIYFDIRRESIQRI